MAELSLLENYSPSSSTLLTKIEDILNNVQKTSGPVLMMLYDYVMTLKMRLKIKNRSQRYDIN